MPNWCYNELVVEGQEKSLMKFFQQAASGDQPIQLHALLPAEEDDLESLLSVWGTPAEIEDSRVQLLPLSDSEEEASYALVYSFFTPWGPPDVWVENISHSFTDLTFHLRYGISEIDIASILTVKKGEVDRESEAFYHEVFPDF